MSKRNPNDPIPGFEDEFTGTIGKEKRVHKTHFQIEDKRKIRDNLDTGYKWVKVGSRWKRVKKEEPNACC